MRAFVTSVLVLIGVVVGYLVAVEVVWRFEDIPVLDVLSVVVLAAAGGFLGYWISRRKEV